MKGILKKTCAVFMSAAIAVTMASCGAQFNTVGATVGNMLNGGEVTSQNGSTYYLKDGDIYKTDSVSKEGKVIKEGDIGLVNIVGDKIYYYDNEISTICKVNSEGDREEWIAELYCDAFTVSKDNVYASVLTGQGGDDLEDSDNYSVVRMKVTDTKLSSTMPKVLIEKARLIGCAGDNIYVKKKTDKGEFLYSYDNDGNNEKQLMALPEDGEVIVDSSAIYLIGTVDKAYGIYKYSMSGEDQKLITAVNKNTKTGANAINIYDGYIYYEDCVTASGGTVTDTIIKMSVDGAEKTTVMTADNASEYQLAAGADGMMVKVRAAGDINTHPNWEAISEEEAK